LGGETDHPKRYRWHQHWDSSEDWQNWYESEERRQIQSKIDAIPSVETTYQIYEDIKTE
jgi:heme-degrading monooxygenase HmoA